jgi:membrane protease YdiL (CAAX protease family)
MGGGLPLGALFAALDLHTVITESGEAPIPESPRRLILETQFTFVLAIVLAWMAVAVLIGARLVFHRPAWTFVSPATPFRLRLLGAGFVLFGAIALASLAVERALRGEALAPPVFDADYLLHTRLIYAGGSALFLLLAAAAEELVFRGVLLQATGAVVRSLPVLIVVNGLVFSAFHLDPSPGAFAARAISGAVWTWTVLRLAGLEFAVGAHLANNLVVALLVEPISTAAQPGRDYPLEAIVADVVATAVMAGCLLLALRSPRLRAWAEVDPPRPVEAAFD